MDRLTSLTVFGSVVETGGFSAAARRLNMSVTMVSNHVQALEDRLGVRLLNRSTRKVSLTEVGRLYFERSQQVLADLDEADRAATALHATPRGTLRLYTQSAIVRFLAPVASEYLMQYPAVSIDFTTGERMVDLIEGGFDLAIRAIQPPDSALIARKLTPWRHLLCCAPAYLQAHPAPVRPADLAQHNCLHFALYPFGDEWRFEDAAGQPASVRIRGNLVTNNAETLHLMALAGHGIFLAPSFVVADDIKAGALVRLMADFRGVELAINAIYPHRSHLSTKVRSFLDLLAERFQAHRAWTNPADTSPPPPP
jgi:DNA-binding transcriptional LysR family regulator